MRGKESLKESWECESLPFNIFLTFNLVLVTWWIEWKYIFSTWGNLRVRLFLSTSWCISPSLVAKWCEMYQRVLRYSLIWALPYVEKAFSNVAINEQVGGRRLSNILAYYLTIIIKKSCEITMRWKNKTENSSVLDAGQSWLIFNTLHILSTSWQHAENILATG